MSTQATEREVVIEQRLKWPLLVAAVLTIPAIWLEESATRGALRSVGGALNWIVWLAFAFEAVALLRVTRDRRSWVRRHPLDLVLIAFTAPFLPTAWQAARLIRLLRIVRLVRLLMISRRLFSLEGIRDVGVLAMFTVIAGGAAFSAIEKDQHLSTWDGIWWAVTTVTTVGYGDVYPHTTEGRILAVGVMFVGIGFVALLTAAAAQRFAQVSRERGARDTEIIALLSDLRDRLDRMEALNEESAPEPFSGTGAT